MVSANSSTSAGGLASAAIGMRPTRCGATHAMTRRSRCTSSRDLRPLHLDHDLLAGAQRGGVDLRDRRGRERRAVEAAEHRVERLPQLLLDDSPHDVERLGRHLVAALPELGDQRLGEDALADEMIWPSLMYVGPSFSAAIRSRRDSPATELSVPRSRAAHIASGRPRLRRVTTMRPPGGVRRYRVSSGNDARTSDRSRSTSRRHVMRAGSTTHGPWSVNDP